MKLNRLPTSHIELEELIERVREDERNKVNALSQYLEYNPGVVSGNLVFKNSRLPIDCVLDLLRYGLTRKQLFDAYPQLQEYLERGNMKNKKTTAGLHKDHSEIMIHHGTTSHLLGDPCKICDEAVKDWKVVEELVKGEKLDLINKINKKIKVWGKMLEGGCNEWLVEDLLDIIKKIKL